MRSRKASVNKETFIQRGKYFSFYFYFFSAIWCKCAGGGPGKCTVFGAGWPGRKWRILIDLPALDPGREDSTQLDTKTGDRETKFVIVIKDIKTGERQL